MDVAWEEGVRRWRRVLTNSPEWERRTEKKGGNFTNIECKVTLPISTANQI